MKDLKRDRRGAAISQPGCERQQLALDGGDLFLPVPRGGDVEQFGGIWFCAVQISRAGAAVYADAEHNDAAGAGDDDSVVCALSIAGVDRHVSAVDRAGIFGRAVFCIYVPEVLCATSRGADGGGP